MRKRIQSVSKKLCKTLDYAFKSYVIDSSLLATCGHLWHKKDREKGGKFATVLFQTAVLAYLLIMFANIWSVHHPADFQAVSGGI